MDYNEDLWEIMKKYGIMNEMEILSGFIMKFSRRVSSNKDQDIQTKVDKVIRKLRSYYRQLFWKDLFHRSTRNSVVTECNGDSQLRKTVEGTKVDSIDMTAAITGREDNLQILSENGLAIDSCNLNEDLNDGFNRLSLTDIERLSVGKAIIDDLLTSGTSTFFDASRVASDSSRIASEASIIEMAPHSSEDGMKSTDANANNETAVINAVNKVDRGNEIKSSVNKNYSIECMKKASAWYYVTYTDSYDDDDNPPFVSFPWIVFDILCNIKRLNMKKGV